MVLGDGEKARRTRVLPQDLSIVGTDSGEIRVVYITIRILS
jgi:hypothetical protein